MTLYLKSFRYHCSECGRYFRSTRKKGYTTTFVDLGKHKVFIVKLGRSESSLRSSYLSGSKKCDKVEVMVVDLTETYRSIVKKYFPNATIVTDRFHVVRLINHHFLNQ